MRQPFEPDPGNTGAGKRDRRPRPQARARYRARDRTLLPSHSGLGVCRFGTESGGKQARMQLIVNGDPYADAQAGWSVADLLAHLELEPGKVAVELNRDIVPKTGYAEKALSDGDQLEILHFVGGGSATAEVES